MTINSNNRCQREIMIMCIMEGMSNLSGAIVAPIYRDRNTLLIVYLHSRLDSSQDPQVHPQLVGLVKSSNGMEKWAFSNVHRELCIFFSFSTNVFHP